MIINNRVLIPTLACILCAYTLYSFSFELVLTVFLNIVLIIRIIHRKFYLYHLWSEWTLGIIKLVLLLFFHFRGYLGSSWILIWAYYLLQICLITSIGESIYYIFKTFQARNEQSKKITLAPENVKVVNNEFSLKDNDEANFIFNKKRMQRHKTPSDVEIASTKVEVKEFHGFKVKVLSEEQKQNFLKSKIKDK